MSTLAEATDYVIERLASVGVSATLDQRDLNPPAVLIGWPQLTFDVIDVVSYSAEYPLFAVVGNTGRANAQSAVWDLIRKVTSVLTPSGPIEPTDLASLDGGDPLPAYRIPTLLTVTED